MHLITGVAFVFQVNQRGEGEVLGVSPAPAFPGDGASPPRAAQNVPLERPGPWFNFLAFLKILAVLHLYVL